MFKPETDKAPDRVELGVAERERTGVQLSAPEFERKLDEVCRMESADYLRQRKAKAEELGIPCSLLDGERKRRQKETESEAAVMQAHWHVEPWHEPVKAGSVYRRIKKRILRHVIMAITPPPHRRYGSCLLGFMMLLSIHRSCL
jgi:hypothetical protein